MMKIKSALLSLFAFAFITCIFISNLVLAQEIHQSNHHDFKLTPIVEGLEHPWGVAFLPNGDMLITERDNAQLRLVKDFNLIEKPIENLPNNIITGGQGGLLDVAIDPNFKQNQFIYLSYSGSGDGGAGTEVIRAKLHDHRLQDVMVIFKAQPKTRGRAHYGSRLVFGDDGTLFLTVGDRYRFMDEAQNPQNHLGSVIRIFHDGTIPADNPFANQNDGLADIFSYGHRNPQGLAKRPSDGKIWLHEHGPKGGDELNLLTSGANYGWPAITYGIDYTGFKISDKTHEQGMEQPIAYWVPSIAPSGMVFYDSVDKSLPFANWQGDLFIGALAGLHLRRLRLLNNRVIEEEVLLTNMARIRDVEMGDDGYLYIITDDDPATLYRLEPL